jgi:cupin 2 domain-containing protein
MTKIPSRKFPTAKRKIPSRPFPKSKAKIPSKPFAKGRAKIASRKLSKAPAAASKKPDSPKPLDRPTNKTTRQERLSTLKGKMKSVTPAINLELPDVDSPVFSSNPISKQTEDFAAIHFNLFADLPQQLSDELFTTLLESKNLRIERIVSHGHASPDGFWYDQDHHEWVMVLKGAARLSFEDETVEMKPGDFVNIPAHKKHRVEWTMPDEPTIWLAAFYE